MSGSGSRVGIDRCTLSAGRFAVDIGQGIAASVADGDRGFVVAGGMRRHSVA
jgi:hypothetical protein